jgi:hypothetical protein
MTFRLLTQVVGILLLTAFLVNQYNYLDADWCSAEVDTLRLQVNQIHTQIINDRE